MKMHLILGFLFLMLPACDGKRESRSRAAAKYLAKARGPAINSARPHVVKFGSFALPDIEEQLSATTAQGRLNMIEALDAIGDPEAKPLLRILIRWAKDPLVRQSAEAALAKLDPPGKS
jgi:HEAT repeat protein